MAAPPRLLSDASSASSFNRRFWLAAHALAATAITMAAPAFAQRRMPLIAPSPSPSAPLSQPLADPQQAVQPLPVQPALQPATVLPSPPESSGTPARLDTGLVTIESDLQRADQATGVVTATGNVRIVYPDQRVVATARQAQYFSKEGRVVLSGDVDIVQEGGNLMRAEQVVYLVNAERLTAIPPAGQQVFSRMRIQTQPISPGAPRP